MNTASLRDMIAATRLTRAGRLTEATAFLQRLLHGGAASRDAHPPVGAGGPIIDLVAETIEMADADPSPRTEPAYRVDAGRGRFGDADGAVRPPMPAALRSFLERDGFKLPLGGLASPSPPEAPAVVPDGAQFLTATFSNQVGSRPYKLYVPSGYHGQGVPLIVMLHGCTQSPDDFAAGTRMNVAAEEHTCLVVYPGQTTAANMSKCWNWFSAGDQQRDRGEPSLIAGITREVMRQYAIDPRRVYVAGLSAGAAAAAIMGAAYPDLYAAIGVHSGLACGAASDLPSAFAAMRQGNRESACRLATPRGGARQIIPAIVFHGDQDTTVHPRNGDDVIAQSAPATLLETRVEVGSVPGGHTYSRTLHADTNGETVLEQWVVHGAGHAWAGGSLAGSYTDPHGPNATREMLRFFLEHPRRANPQRV
jgi:poly(hydroxyalkanoate) depolymerase family esterase